MAKLEKPSAVQPGVIDDIIMLRYKQARSSTQGLALSC